MSSTTTNYNLNKPDKGFKGWDVSVNNNFDIIDTEIKNRANDIITANNKVGNLSTLTTDYKTDLVGAVNEHETQINDFTNLYSDKLAKYIKLMQNNGSVVIDCKGDSTYYGQTTGGAQTAEPVSVVLQKVLQGYFYNTNITCNNLGVSGSATSDVINSWDTYLASTSANIIFINYCLNDPYKGVTPEQYRANLKTIVLKTRKAGKEIILDLPNQNINIPSINVNANQINSENTKYYANIMLSVSLELEVPLINNINSVDVQWEYFKSPTDTLTDGVHPVQSFYNFKAVQMARFLIFNEHSKNIEYIPCYSNLFKHYGNTSSTATFGGAKYGWGAEKNRIAFWVEKPSDLVINCHMASSSTFATTNNIAKTINCNLDNVAVVSAFSLILNGTTADGSGYKEFLIAKNLKRGLHYLEVDGVDGMVFLNYIKLLDARYDEEVLSQSVGNIIKKVASGSRYFLRKLQSIPTSVLNKVIEFDAFLVDGFGFEIVGEKAVGTSDPLALSIYTGLLVSGEKRSGVFNVGLSQTCDATYSTTTDKKVLLADASLENAWKNIKLFIDVVNLKAALYIDNIKKLELSLLDAKLSGGFVSLIRSTSDTTTDTTMYIKNLNYRYGNGVVV